jgi:hypothetical protein
VAAANPAMLGAAGLAEGPAAKSGRLSRESAVVHSHTGQQNFELWINMHTRQNPDALYLTRLSLATRHSRYGAPTVAQVDRIIRIFPSLKSLVVINGRRGRDRTNESLRPSVRSPS